MGSDKGKQNVLRPAALTQRYVQVVEVVWSWCRYSGGCRVRLIARCHDEPNSLRLGLVVQARRRRIIVAPHERFLDQVAWFAEWSHASIEVTR